MARKEKSDGRVKLLSRFKIRPPSISGKLVDRLEIFARIVAFDAARLITLVAPAGFGKTTTMVQLFQHFKAQGMEAAWLSLDEGDNDVSRFLFGFVQALSHLSGAKEEDYQGRSNSELADIAAEIVADAPKPVVVFFDGLEVVKNPVVLGMIARGVDILAPGSRMVVGSRREPEFGLASLRAKGVLLEISRDELRFSEQEARSFLAARLPQGLSETHVQELVQRTEGWITALSLAGLALTARDDIDSVVSGFSGSSASVAAYLAEDVLAKLPDDHRQFLLQVSILEEMRSSICDAVTGRDDSTSLLKMLEAQNLFLSSFDDSPGIYRFHALFRDFLQQQLEQARGQAQVRGLHRRAAEAYLNIERPVAAIRHAIHSQDWSFAIPLLEQYQRKILNDGRIRLLGGFLELIPSAEIARWPRLQILHAWCVAFNRGPKQALELTGNLDARNLDDEEAKANLLALKPMLLAMTDDIQGAHNLALEVLGSEEHNSAFSGGMLYQVITQTSIILGMHDQARHYVDVARDKHAISVGEFGFVLAESAEALIDVMTGHLRQAYARLNVATRKFTGSKMGGNRGNAVSAIQLAEVLYEQDQLDRSRQLLEAYSPQVRDLGPPDALILTCVLLSRIYFSAGEVDQAFQYLSELEGAGHRLQLGRVVASARLERANIYTALNDFRVAEEQISLVRDGAMWSERDWYVANDCLYPTLVECRLLVRSGKAGKALPVIKRELATAESEQRGRRALKLRFLLAEALVADNQRNIGLRNLTRALEIAQREGFKRCYLEEGPFLESLVNESTSGQSQGDVANEPARDIQSPVEEFSKAEAVSSALADPLTKKELEVLILLSHGLSNQAMAEKLFISDSTVRTHLRSINLKLHASNRTQAIAIARKLGLVS